MRAFTLYAKEPSMSTQFEDFAVTLRGADLTTVELDNDAGKWPFIIAHYGDKTAVIRLCGVGDPDGDSAHLCVDVQAYVGGRQARSSAFGMEAGRRLDAFAAADTEGTSHGLPAARLVAVLIGGQGAK